ncbi:MAG: NAD(P)/FAD-dependent oxidoreductase [bacterium]|nr:NAD(P)/FAD-dependent oxidoreductase [bacterium]
MYDITIIGAGITGTSIARELSKYELNILLIDKSYDVSNGSTKANSAIVHAGYDCKPGTLMAKFNKLGNQMFENLCNELSVPFKRIGSLVLAFNDDDLNTIENLHDRGHVNDIPGLSLITAEEVFKIEPNISKNIKGGLLAETAGIVSPYELAIALTENAIVNGINIQLNTEVFNIEKENEYFNIVTNKNEILTKIVINASGVYADKINDMVSQERFRIIPKKGQYMLLNKTAEDLAKHVIFQCPTQKGKGILVTPTVYGNILIGPDSQETEDRLDVAISENKLEYIKETALKSFDNIPFNKIIKKFAGLRAEADTGDFIVGESSDCKNFFNAAGIKSPGLTSAPALAEYLVSRIIQKFSNLSKKNNFIKTRNTSLLQFMSAEKQHDLKHQNDTYNNIVCKCEQISEGEILDVLSRFPHPTTRDGIKRRTRAGMGPCQGRHCGPIVDELLK